MTRVQIPAYTDRWMMGDRFGEIVSIREARPDTRAALLTDDPRRYSGKVEIARVRLDRSGVTVSVILSDCEVLS
jgi:hypothetical protein